MMMNGLAKRIIKISVDNSQITILLWMLIAIVGVLSVRSINLDAIPDLSDAQVIVRTHYEGQSPQIVEDQVTFPITRKLLSIPEATAVRGFSQFGDSYVYVIFKDGVDTQWARTRVLEYLSQLQYSLPNGVQPALGPDASAVGWVFEYALASQKQNLAELRSLQDWFVIPELQGIAGVAEVATIGGMVKQYQIIIDPEKQRQRGISLSQIAQKVKQAGAATGGSVLELAEAEYAIQFTGYLNSIEDIQDISIGLDNDSGTPIYLRDIADIRIGPQKRRGIADLNGDGEVVGGIVVMQTDANPLEVIDRVKEKIATLKLSLPQEVELITTYDRSELIIRAVENLGYKLLLEILVIALVCFIFLGQLRSSLVVVVSLPLGILAAFAIMKWQGLTANIMSLGGIAITVGAMVDAAVVLVENAHRRLEEQQAGSDQPLSLNQKKATILSASIEVGPALFVSLLIIMLSFVPLLALEAQAGRLFQPMVFTKTYAMAAAAAVSITLLPVLAVYILRINQPDQEKGRPINVRVMQILEHSYTRVLEATFRMPWMVTVFVLGLVMVSIYPAMKSGTEFMPKFDEGDLLYMPTTLPGVSIAKARELLVVTDKLIQSVPEVQRTFGKVGRADTATDPAPLHMLETTILLKPRHEWRAGMTPEKIIAELDRKVKIPGLINAWVQPIKTRIDMLSTGIRTPLGITITGSDSKKIQQIGTEVEAVLNMIPETSVVFSDRNFSGRYLKIEPDRQALSRYGLSIEEVSHTVRYAIGGATIDFTVEDAERYPINLRYPQHSRDSISKLSRIPLISKTGAQVLLGDVCRLYFDSSDAVIKTENSRLTGRVLIETADISPGDYLRKAAPLINQKVTLPAGYSLRWSGEYEHMERTYSQLSIVIPMTLLIIASLLLFVFSDWLLAMIPLFCLPLALSGGIWLLWLLDMNVSVASVAGFIALAGVAVEFSVVMLLYLENVFREGTYENGAESISQINALIIKGAVKRVRPKLMTVAILLAGLSGIMFGHGIGTDVMQKIAAPMIGGMVTAPILSMLVIPMLYRAYRVSQFKREGHSDQIEITTTG